MFRKLLSCYLVIAVLVLTSFSSAHAGFVSSGKTLPPSVERQADLATVQVILEDKLVRQRLVDLGFTSGEIDSRLSRLSDNQLHSLAMDIDQVRAGGLLEALLIVFLVIIILDLTGHTSIIVKK